MDALYRFKLLAGPLTGRELELRSGVFTVGGDDPDLAVPLEDGAVCRLEVCEEGIALLDAVPYWIDGVPGPDGERLPLGRALDIAGLLMVVVAAGEAMPSVRAVPRRRAAGGRGARRMAVGGVVAVLLAAALVWGGRHLQEETSPPFDPLEPIATLRGEPGWANLGAARGADGVLTVSGDCADSARLAMLRETLSRHGVPMRDETVCRDELVGRVEAVLRGYGYRDSRVVALPAQGWVDIRGDIRFDTRWEGVARRLADVPGLAGWNVGNDTAEVLADLAAMLLREGLLDGVGVTRQGERLWVGARLPDARQRALVDALARFSARDGRGLEIRLQAIPPSREAANMLPAPVTGVGGDPRSPYLELANGVRLSPGARLPQGRRLLALSRHGLSLLGDDGLFYLPFDL